MISLLLVEDIEILRVGLRLVLERISDFKILAEVGDGRTALTAASSQKPDLILLDIGLPDINGIELTKKIKVLSPLSKILILTSHDSLETVLEVMSAGAEGYCIKQNAMTQLEGAIRSICDGNGWLDPNLGSLLTKFNTATKDTARTIARYAISARELEVIALIVEGLSNQQIADKLTLSPETVKSHLRRIMDKLLVNDRTQIAVKALREGII